MGSGVRGQSPFSQVQEILCVNSLPALGRVGGGSWISSPLSQVFWGWRGWGCPWCLLCPWRLLWSSCRWWPLILGYKCTDTPAPPSWFIFEWRWPASPMRFLSRAQSRDSPTILYSACITGGGTKVDRCIAVRPACCLLSWSTLEMWTLTSQACNTSRAEKKRGRERRVLNSCNVIGEHSIHARKQNQKSIISSWRWGSWEFSRRSVPEMTWALAALAEA